ncbi:MAG: PAS domain S-box protein, partial [SAR324 cluster bacterium]|nr:PAS domain S-box protein [SAR324 cluster bacterium]
MIKLTSIRAKLLLILTLVLSATVVVTLNISNHLVGGFHEKHQRESMNRAWRLSNSMLANIKSNTRHRAELIGVLPVLSTVVENKDLSTIQDITSEYQAQLDLDILEIYNISGNLLTSIHPKIKNADSVGFMVENSLDNGEVFLSYLHFNNQLHYIASTPIGLPDDPTGALVVGTTIDKNFLDQVKKQANVNVSLVRNNRSYLSTLSPENEKALNQTLQNTAIEKLVGNGESVLELDNNLVRIRRISNVSGEVVCYVVIMYSLEESKSLLQGLQNSIILGGFLTLVASLILGYLFVKLQVITPFDRLVSFIFHIEKTGDKTQRFIYEKDDEISTISHALNRLLEGQETLVSELEQSNRQLKFEIAERIINEERIKKLSMAVEQSPAAIMITNKKGDIEYVNYKFSQVTGYQSEEIIGENPKILNTTDTNQELVEVMWDAIYKGKEWLGELQNQTKQGVKYFERVHLCPILTPIGEISNYVLISEDITKQKEFHEELIRAKDDAQAANIAKSQFLANMSHEIRTPMNAVLGMTQLVLEMDLDAEQKELLTIALTAGESLLVLINDILDLSKIESGKFELLFQEFSIFHLIQSIGDIFEHKFAAKKVDFAITVDPNIPKVIVGDMLRIRQVLVNLIGNANKFTSEGC